VGNPVTFREGELTVALNLLRCDAQQTGLSKEDVVSFSYPEPGVVGVSGFPAGYCFADPPIPR
jgi:hypothetical protein